MKECLCVCAHVLFYLEIAAALSSHLCAKQTLQTYSLDYDRAFICPERYTTSCGQLDWRRCTKYRVSTCYTPSQKYASRYVTVEVCCPGWRGDTCSEPICTERCQNGGVCSDLGGHPGCRCADGYYGDDCSHARNQSDAFEVVMACCAGLVTVVVIVIAVLLYRRVNPSRVLPAVPACTIPETNNQSGRGTQDIRHFEQQAVPSAPHLIT